ncbi:MAG: 1,6-anhydro-N-acetylmuramyl-L-alanine amidase AmpD [Rhodocyclaceae bacterium]|nr:1,6-anhydro-N-acetylmuramyl-L-alanine amidase AmpD [Rhodocyclaceae bacterium]
MEDDGWARDVQLCPSPNCDARPAGVPLSLIVVHAISLPPEGFGGRQVEAFFQNRLDPGEHPYFASICAMRVSAHFLIRRNGEVVQFVPAGLRAWHAGVSRWRERERCNDFSVGIELEGSDTQPFAPPQYDALARLTDALRERYPTIEAIAGHDEIAPGRKTDPGPYFQWARLLDGLAVPLQRK